MTIIKICGITNLQDAITAINAGADMLGFNFYTPSPRSIKPEDCAHITTVLSKEHPETILVGVFVNMPFPNINNILNLCNLHLAQLHGDETPEILADFNGKAFKAFRGIPDKEMCRKYPTPLDKKSPAFLLDASVQGIYGGSGITADWSAAALLAREFPILLAGGLKPENVSEAIRKVQPWGVDVASGVEKSPGQKDEQRILEFVKSVRSAATQSFD